MRVALYAIYGLVLMLIMIIGMWLAGYGLVKESSVFCTVVGSLVGTIYMLIHMGFKKGVE